MRRCSLIRYLLLSPAAEDHAITSSYAGACPPRGERQTEMVVTEPVVNGRRSHPQRASSCTLFAALDVLSGKVFGQCLPQHTNNELLQQLRHPRPRQRPGLAGQAPPVPLPFHAHVELVAQPGGAVVPGAHPKSHTPWRVPFRPRPRGCDRGLPPGLQRRPKPFVWTASAEDILRKVSRARVALQPITT
jgi:hypothetical protein